jgi:hypothetical protein
MTTFIGNFQYHDETNQECLGHFVGTDVDGNFIVQNFRIVDETEEVVVKFSKTHADTDSLQLLDLVDDKVLISSQVERSKIYCFHIKYFVQGILAHRDGMNDIFGVFRRHGDQIPEEDSEFPFSTECLPSTQLFSLPSTQQYLWERISSSPFQFINHICAEFVETGFFHFCDDSGRLAYPI